MNLVDSCGWLEYFAGGPNQGFFSPALERASDLLVPTVCIAEVFKRILQQHQEHVALQSVASMHRGHVAEMTSTIALDAAKIGFRHNLSLADSIIVATARIYHATIWTQDADLKEMPGVRYRRAR